MEAIASCLPMLDLRLRLLSLFHSLCLLSLLHSLSELRSICTCSPGTSNQFGRCQQIRSAPSESCGNGEACDGGSFCSGSVCSCPPGTVISNRQCLTPSTGWIYFPSYPLSHSLAIIRYTNCLNIILALQALMRCCLLSLTRLALCRRRAGTLALRRQLRLCHRRLYLPTGPGHCSY